MIVSEKIYFIFLSGFLGFLFVHKYYVNDPDASALITFKKPNTHKKGRDFLCAKWRNGSDSFFPVRELPE